MVRGGKGIERGDYRKANIERNLGTRSKLSRFTVILHSVHNPSFASLIGNGTGKNGRRQEKKVKRLQKSQQRK